MKTKKYILLSFTLMLSSCNNSLDEKIKKENHNATIFIASDLHFLAPSLVSKENTKYQKETMTSDGRIQELDYEIVNSFVNDINTNKPDYVILTGDLTFNGESKSHEELKELFDRIDSNIKVLVIPGNHDTYNINSYSFINDTRKSTNSITQKEFQNIYSNYGYSYAFSYDDTTSSYAYILDDNYMAIMIDTTLSIFNYDDDYNYVSGGLSKETLDWIEENLNYAKENNLKVISFSHHNLVNHNPLFTNLYTMGHNELLMELYKKYNVNLHFSGHLHIQNIQKENNIYDISSSSLIDYPCQYGILDLYDNCFEYHTKSVSLDQIEEKSFNCFYDKYYNKNQSLEENVLDYISKVNCYYFAGNYEEINRLNKKYVKEKKIIEEQNNAYQQSIINVENKNQTYLISKWL